MTNPAAGAVVHVHGTSVNSGVLVYKRIRCVAGRCFVMKIGMCLTTSTSPFPNIYGSHTDANLKAWAAGAQAALLAAETNSGTSMPVCTGNDLKSSNHFIQGY